MQKLNILAVSDSIGETAEQISRAVLRQFDVDTQNIIRFSHTDDKEKIDYIIKEAERLNAVIVFTIVINEIKNYIIEKSKEKNIIAIDIITPLMNPLMEHFGLKPKGSPGLLREMDERYFKRVEAIEFAVKYDDGKSTKGIEEADVVIIGISRTSKTPLSMYLANKNIKVANFPIVPEVEPPEEIFQINPKKIVGLTAGPDHLNRIRKERLKALGLKDNASYANMNRIIEELEYSINIMKKIGCKTIDISDKAIEETAGIILNWYKENNYK
jgi:hypothetical protein